MYLYVIYVCKQVMYGNVERKEGNVVINNVRSMAVL